MDIEAYLPLTGSVTFEIQTAVMKSIISNLQNVVKTGKHIVRSIARVSTDTSSYKIVDNLIFNALFIQLLILQITSTYSKRRKINIYHASSFWQAHAFHHIQEINLELEKSIIGDDFLNNLGNIILLLFFVTLLNCNYNFT